MVEEIYSRDPYGDNENEGLLRNRKWFKVEVILESTKLT